MSVRRALVAALLVPLALVSACTEDDPVPQMPDPTTSEPSPTKTTSTAAPETPEEFIRRFNDANVEMQATGDAAEFLALTQECRPCSETAAKVEGFYSHGGFVKWEGWTILKVAHDFDTDQGAEYRIEVRTPRTRFKESGTAPTQTLDGGKVVYRAALVKHADSWLVSDLVQVSQ